MMSTAINTMIGSDDTALQTGGKALDKQAAEAARTSRVERHHHASLLQAADLPGPLSARRLHDAGMASELDQHTLYCNQQAYTLRGRSRIVQAIAPWNTVTCGLLAAWVWLGGAFPPTIDVISQSRFRATLYGRRVRTFKRRVPDEHLLTLGALHITHPTRTACDIAMLPETEQPNEALHGMIYALLHNFRGNPEECLRILEQNPYWSHKSHAKKLLQAVQAELTS